MIFISNYIIILFIGGLLGISSYFISLWLIANISHHILPKSRIIHILYAIIWCLFNSLSWYCISLIKKGISTCAIEIMILFSICLIISAVDYVTFKVPNIMLIALLVVCLFFLIINYDLNKIFMHIFSFVGGFVIFMMPLLFGKSSSWGDVKYASIISLYLGFYKSLIAYAIMSVVILLFFIYSSAFKKVLINAPFAMAPFMSLGFIATLLYLLN